MGLIIGTEEDFWNFMQKYKGDPLLKGKPKGVFSPVDHLNGVAMCVHPIGSGKCTIGGGVGAPSGGGTGGGGPSALAGDHLTFDFNPLFFKPHDPDIDPSWGVDPADPMHPIRQGFEKAVEMGIEEAVYWLFIEAPLELVGVVPLVSGIISGVLTTTETSKKATLLSTNSKAIFNLEGNRIGTSTVLWLGDDSETHIITDNNNNTWHYEEDSTPESQQINLWEFRDDQRPPEAKDDHTDPQSNTESDGTAPENTNSEPKEEDSENSDEPEYENNTTLWMATLRRGERRVDVNYGEPIVFVYA